MTVAHQFTVNQDGNRVLLLILLQTSSKQQNKTFWTQAKVPEATLGLGCLLFCCIRSPFFAQS